MVRASTAAPHALRSRSDHAASPFGAVVCPALSNRRGPLQCSRFLRARRSATFRPSSMPRSPATPPADECVTPSATCAGGHLRCHCAGPEHRGQSTSRPVRAARRASCPSCKDARPTGTAASPRACEDPRIGSAAAPCSVSKFVLNSHNRGCAMYRGNHCIRTNVLNRRYRVGRIR